MKMPGNFLGYEMLTPYFFRFETKPQRSNSNQTASSMAGMGVFHIPTENKLLLFPRSSWFLTVAANRQKRYSTTECDHHTPGWNETSHIPEWKARISPIELMWACPQIGQPQRTYSLETTTKT